MHNCGLTLLDPETGEAVLYKSHAHLPPEWITENMAVVGIREEESIRNG